MSHAEASPHALGPLDAMTASPEHHGLLLENEQVRVLDTRISPGERTAVHTHAWPAALYVLSWSDFVRYDPDGEVLLDSRTMTSKPKTGDSLWASPLPAHSVHNVGDAELRVLAVEIKKPL